jgi:DNA-binding transcriptional LysR family regulator
MQMMLKTSIRYFLSVARHGSIRAASAELNVAQSAVSRQIQALESDLGCQIITRLPRGIALTEAGELLLQYGLSADQDHTLLKAAISNIESLNAGHVSVAAIESVASNTLPLAISRYIAAHPNITIDVDITTSTEIFKMVQSGQCEIGIMFGVSNDEQFTVHYHTEGPLLAVAKPDHPLARLDFVDVADLAGWPVALPPRGSGSRDVFDQACQRVGVEIEPVLETNSLELLHRFALGGGGVTVLLGQLIASSISGDALTAIRFRDAAIQGDITVVTAANRSLSKAAETFLQTLRQTFDHVSQAALAG